MTRRKVKTSSFKFDDFECFGHGNGTVAENRYLWRGFICTPEKNLSIIHKIAKIQTIIVFQHTYKEKINTKSREIQNFLRRQKKKKTLSEFTEKKNQHCELIGKC